MARRYRNQNAQAVSKTNSIYDRFKKWFTALIKKTRAAREVEVRNSMQWYLNRVRIATGKNLQNPKAYKTVKDLRAGGVFQYTYDPKWKVVLPYYDKFPLIVPIEMTKNGWLALNLHYLPPAVRAIVFDDIIQHAPDKSRMKVAYDWVMSYKKHPIIQHGVKRYLVTHVTSPLVSVHEDEWLNIIMMPTQTFVKKSDQYVWSDGARLYHGGDSK